MTIKIGGMEIVSLSEPLEAKLKDALIGSGWTLEGWLKRLGNGMSQREWTYTGNAMKVLVFGLISENQALREKLSNSIELAPKSSPFRCGRENCLLACPHTHETSVEL